MTSLTPTLYMPPHDTPAVRVLVPGLPVFALDCTVEEAGLVAELLSDLVWRQQVLACSGFNLPQQKGR